MCKVMMMYAIKKENVNKAISFVKTIAPLMSEGNNHGLGYAAIDKAGKLFGERWFVNAHAFKPLPKPSDTNITKELFKDAVEPYTFWEPDKPEYNSFGQVDLENMTAITMHTRMATSEKVFKNTHPFVHNDTSLIHNGVIRNYELYTKEMKTTCDSEAILHSYIQNKVARNPDNIGELADELIGYYACAVLSRDKEGNRILDIFKGHNNNLHVVFVNELDTYVFSTSVHDIKTACEKLGFTYRNVCTVKDGILIRLNPFTGEILCLNKFTLGKEFTYSANRVYPYRDTDDEEYNYSNLNNVTTYQGGKKTESESKVISLINKQKEKRMMTKEEIAYRQLPVACRVVGETEIMETLTQKGLWN